MKFFILFCFVSFRRRAGRGAFLLITAAASLTGQPDWVISAQKWTGTIAATGDYEETDIGGFKHTISVRLSGSFTMEPPTDPDSPYSFEGKLTQTAISIKYRGNGVSGCPFVDTFEASGPTIKEDPTVHLTHFRNTWTFSGGIYRLRGDLKRTYTCPPPQSGGVVIYEDMETAVVMSLASLPYPSAGPTLTSNARTSYPIQIGPALFNIQAGTPLDYTLSMTSSGEPDLDLEITSAGYPDWRPTAADDGGEGQPLELTATLKSRSGGELRQKIDTLTWELVETSREPGYTINWPKDAADREPDLFFKEELSLNGSVYREPIGEEGQKVEVTYLDSDGVSDKIQIYPRDWGGWSTLRAVATLKGGKKVVGRWKGASEDDVRLPDRDPGRFIAKSWLKQKGITDADRSDLDDQPEGDGQRGDGLTLYEEYRGFRMDGRRLEGNPKRKEYFAVNEAGSPGRGGLAHFTRITGLNVQARLTRDEIGDDRVINRNFSASPRIGPQHAVVILNRPEYQGFAKAESTVDRPSTPRDIEYVGLPSAMPSRPTMSPAISYASATVAHELLHTVNVYHHGEEDEVVFWSRDGEGKLYEQQTEDQNGTDAPVGPKKEVRAFLESGQEVTDRVRVGLRNLGARNGQHSGWENCVMRYDVADTYVSDTNANDRFVGVREAAGAALCDTTEGISVNAPGRNPQSRYGPAAASRGVCKQQILVNDAVNAPRR